MKIVIDIPEEMWERVKDGYVPLGISKYLKNGTPLPKGHGRLIDADAFIAMLKDATERQRYIELLIDNCLIVDDVIDAIIESLQNKGLAEGDAPTIIPADKENEE